VCVSELLRCEIERKGIDAGKSVHIAELVTRWKNVAGQGQKEVSSIFIREDDAGESKVSDSCGRTATGCYYGTSPGREAEQCL
jgi:hypothetical protein